MHNNAAAGSRWLLRAGYFCTLAAVLLLLCCIAGCPRPLDRLGAERNSRVGRGAAELPHAARSADGETKQAGAMPNAYPEQGPAANADGLTAAEELLAEGWGDNEADQRDTVEGGDDNESGNNAGASLENTLPQAPPPGAKDIVDGGSQVGEGESTWKPPQLAGEKLALPGRWRVLAVSAEGKTRLLSNTEEWVFWLGPDGKAAVSQNLDGGNWRSEGTWLLSRAVLSIDSTGPHGKQSYEVSRFTEETLVLNPTTEVSALFCARLAQDEPAAQPATAYDSDFGRIDITASGPGRWQGSYGAPPGTLNLTAIGHCAVGTWAQAESKGYVIFSLQRDGFLGIWWYAGGLSADGVWVGQTVK